MAPALFGGLCLCLPDGRIDNLPPLLAPHRGPSTPVIKTAEARAVLPKDVPMSDASPDGPARTLRPPLPHRRRHGSGLCAKRPRRATASRSNHISKTSSSGRHAGARAGGISGSGPSSYWITDADTAQSVGQAISNVFLLGTRPRSRRTHASRGAHILDVRPPCSSTAPRTRTMAASMKPFCADCRRTTASTSRTTSRRFRWKPGWAMRTRSPSPRHRDHLALRRRLHGT